MAHLLVLEFTSDTARELYEGVDRTMGIDSVSGTGDWPAGMQSHVAGVDGDTFVVVEVWDSKQNQEQFMADRLGPALHQNNAPRPSRVQWLDLIGQKR